MLDSSIYPSFPFIQFSLSSNLIADSEYQSQQKETNLMDTNNPFPLLREGRIKRKQCGKEQPWTVWKWAFLKKKKKYDSQELRQYLNVVVQRFIHSAVLADNPAPRSTLSRWHGVALEDSIFNPLGTDSTKQEVERMLWVRRQSGHFILARCRVGHKSAPAQVCIQGREGEMNWHLTIQKDWVTSNASSW